MRRRRVGGDATLALLIRNGTVYDGTGAAPCRQDLGVCDGRIVALAAGLDAPARETVDARGLWLVPGFLDIHTHYDIEVEIAPGLSESVRHGVTSVVLGNCSLSLTLGDPATLADIFLRVENLPRVLVLKWLRQSVGWDSPAEYFAHLRALPLGSNVAALLGHSALRAVAMGLERSLSAHATDAELARMRRLASAALDAGCIGISADMVPWHMMSGAYRGRTIPSQHAAFREYAMLAELCRERDAVFQVTPNPQNLASFLQILWLSLGVRRRPLRSTILAALDSVSNRALWRVLPPVLTALNRGLGANIRFQTLTEPFTVYSDGPLTPLFEEFPAGVRLNDADSRAARRALWASPAFRRAFAREWTRGWRKTFHRDLALMSVVRCPDRSLEGKTFAAVARERGREPVETFMDLLATHDTALRWVATGANDRLGPRLALMRHPAILPGFTDAGAHARNLGYYDGALSLLKQAVATGFLTPEAAIHRVTGEPARWFRLDTGVVREGARADLVLIRPAALHAPLAEQVEIDDPVLNGAMRMVKRGSDDIVHAVYIAGVPVVRDGKLLPALGAEPLGCVLTLYADAVPWEPRPQASGATSGLPASPPRQRQVGSRDWISTEVREHPFTDYWDVFVLKHQHPANVACHMAGVAVWYAAAALAVMTWSPWWLCGLPLSQLLGLAGHALFEPSHIDRRDAVFSLRATRCLNRMAARVVTGRYRRDVETLRARLADYQERGARESVGRGRSSAATAATSVTR